MNTSTHIRLFVPSGDSKSLRTAEIIGWTGWAIAAPRTEFDELMKREELDRSGTHILLGTDPETGRPRGYIGETEVIRERLRQHRAREFWVTVIVFVRSGAPWNPPGAGGCRAVGTEDGQRPWQKCQRGRVRPWCRRRGTTLQRLGEEHTISEVSTMG